MGVGLVRRKVRGALSLVAPTVKVNAPKATSARAIVYPIDSLPRRECANNVQCGAYLC